MSDEDNFESLSNAEIRAKCIEQGLPNVPVTDSSRKVLIKKLRVSLGGGSHSPASIASPMKAAARRETVHAARQLLPEKINMKEATGSDIEQKDVQRARGRRTIGTTPPLLDKATNSKEASPAPAAEAAPITERRRSVREQLLAKTSERRTEPLAVVEEVEVEKQTAAPVRMQQRRISAQPDERPPATRIPQRRDPIPEEEREVLPRKAQQPTLMASQEQAAPPVKTITKSVDLAPITQRRNSNQPQQRELIKPNTLLENSLIILESDDDEDEPLSRVAKEIEERSQQGGGHKPVSSHGHSSSAKIMHSGEYYRKTIYTGGSDVGKETAVTTPEPSYYSSSVGTGLGIGMGAGRYGGTAPAGYASSGSGSGFLLSSSISAASSPLFSSHQRASAPPCVNEYSDETDVDDNLDPERIHSPYLSAFTRNLQRLKSEPLCGAAGVRGGSVGSGRAWQRSAVAGTSGQYEPATRRPLRIDDNVDVAGAFQRFWHSLDRKYKLTPKLFALLIVILLILLYVIFS